MLKTKRLILRNLRESDAPVLFACRNDIRCSRYQRYGDTSLDCLHDFVHTWEKSRFLSMEQEQHYAVAGRQNDVLLGDLSIFYSHRDNCFTLGITVVPEFHRKGYAREILEEVIQRLGQHYPACDLVALIEKENEASLALFRKLGFAEECYAESVGSYVYVIYAKG